MNRPPSTTPPPSRRVADAIRRFFAVVSKNPKTGETEIYLTPAHLVAALLALALVIGGVLLGVRACNATPDWTYRFDGKKTTVSGEHALPDGETLYIDLDKVADLAGLTVTETEEEPLFTAPDGSAFRLKAATADVTVNGTRAHMTAPLLLRDGTYWIPLNFLQTVLAGVDFTVNAEKHTVTVTRNGDPVCVRINGSEPEPPDAPALPTATYRTDVTAYLPYIDPADPSPYAILVNRDHPLDATYEPLDLVYLPEELAADDERYRVRETVAKALEAMLSEMAADGITDIAVTSAFRTYAYQEWLFQWYVDFEKSKDATLTDEAARALVATYSAKAGTSEHQTGLCVDFTTASIGGEVSDAFTQTPAAAWLAENAWKFGFVLRFPADKTDLTTFKYESWHFRFVGRTAAAEMYASGQCLEEYLAESTPAA